jgi:hypothetical protein
VFWRGSACLFRPAADHAATAKSLPENHRKQLGLLDIDVKERYVFHTTGNAEVIPLIAASNLRPSRWLRAV